MSSSRYPTVHKERWPHQVVPNLVDYDVACSTHSWQDAWARLDGLPAGGLNIAHEAVDRHATGPRRDHHAMRWLRRDGTTTDATYAQLREWTNRFANVLLALGVERGDRVFALTGRIPELYVAALGTLKRGAVFSPLFSAFGPEPLHQRLSRGDGKVLVTTPALYRRKMASIRDRLPQLRHVLLVGDGDDVPGGVELAAAMAAADGDFAIPITGPDDMALLHFTSGTTGTPEGRCPRPRRRRGASRDGPHRSGSAPRRRLLVHRRSRLGDRHLLRDHRPADPWRDEHRRRDRLRCGRGGTASSQDSRSACGTPPPRRCACSMRAGAELARTVRPSSLRFVASVGEPLNPEAVVWGKEAFGLTGPRQLVADRDRRNHDRQLRRGATSGPAPWAGRSRASRQPSSPGRRRPGRGRSTACR